MPPPPLSKSPLPPCSISFTLSSLPLPSAFYPFILVYFSTRLIFLHFPPDIIYSPPLILPTFPLILSSLSLIVPSFSSCISLWPTILYSFLLLSCRSFLTRTGIHKYFRILSYYFFIFFHRYICYNTISLESLIQVP